MADPDTGMPKADMKRLLNMAKKDPVSCAIGLGSDTKLALLMLDRSKAPRAVSTLLTAAIPGAKNLRWGTAAVDADADPKLVKLTLNSSISGMASKVVKTLRGTGITKVVIVLEDGTEIDRHAGEEAEEEGGQQENEHEGEGKPQGTQPGEAPPDLGQLHLALTELVKRMMPVIAAEPARKDVLAGLAGRAQTHIKAGNAADAAAAIGQLKQALEAGGAPPPPTDTAAAASAETYDKSWQAWLAVRRKIETDLEKLRVQIVATYQDQPDNIRAELETSYRTKTAPVLATLDESLANRLKDAIQETDPARRQALVAAAQEAIARYQAFATQGSLIADLDGNPFVPLTIGAVLGATLKTLAAAVR